MSDKYKSGDSIWYNVIGDITQIDPNWTNWSGSWDLLTALGTPPVATGLLSRTSTPGHFLLQVPLSSSATLSVGNYLLCAQVENLTVDFRKEVAQIKISIQQQGVV